MPATFPRIAPGTPREIGRLAAVLAHVLGRVAGTGPPNIFTTLARHRRLFWRWLWFAQGLMPGGRLPRADTELVILRVAHRCRCAYEEDHERIARTAGLTAQEIAGAREDLATVAWSSRRLALLRATDELHADRRISDATWTELRVHLNEVESIELCMLVGHYEMLAMTLNSVAVQPDAPR